MDGPCLCHVSVAGDDHFGAFVPPAGSGPLVVAWSRDWWFLRPVVDGGRQTYNHGRRKPGPLLRQQGALVLIGHLGHHPCSKVKTSVDVFLWPMAGNHGGPDTILRTRREIQIRSLLLPRHDIVVSVGKLDLQGPVYRYNVTDET
ncbi:hypothetical protein EJB05_55218 [Eragrostis curvula]|uniref:Uncharacterized protein n=1 Tax=Eragrostis curvula TaxID=38414 RepID=A0A5J9SK77_9POAL|nr:hypothetical protein EJB05_55218 [Eragrostis curvula]